MPPSSASLLTTSGAESLSSTYPALDTSACQVVFENGVYGQWCTGFTAKRTNENAAIYKHCRVAAYAERGRVLFEEFGRWQIVSTQEIEGHQTTSDEWRENNDIAQAGLTEVMFDWLEDNTHPIETNRKRALHQ